MGRPAKPVDAQSGNINSDVKESRKTTEDELKGSNVRVTPSFPLTKEQKRIFTRIKGLFQKAELLGELDGYVLTQGAVVIDRLQEIDRRINDDPELLFDRDVCNTRKEYMQSFFRICNELSLSPQARAKMGILAAGNEAEKDDPIVGIFGKKINNKRGALK